MFWDSNKTGPHFNHRLNLQATQFIFFQITDRGNRVSERERGRERACVWEWVSLVSESELLRMKDSEIKKRGQSKYFFIVRFFPLLGFSHL